MIQMMDEPEELLDLVDGTDNPIGTIARREILSLEADKRGYARGVGVFLTNQQGQLWIPRRQPHKKIAPNGLDFSVGEHVGHSESYTEAALRGLREELNIEATADELTCLGTVSPFAGLPYFHQIYLYHQNEEPVHNTDDYSSFEWLSPEELLTRLESGETAKEILLPSVQLIVRNKTSSGVSS